VDVTSGVLLAARYLSASCRTLCLLLAAPLRWWRLLLHGGVGAWTRMAAGTNIVYHLR
jgi:hypothetical protein